MIDVLTGGGSSPGMVARIGAEYYSMGANPAFSHERFHEAMNLVVSSRGRGRGLRFRGQALPLRICEWVAAALSATASADLVFRRSVDRDGRMGKQTNRALCLSPEFSPVASVVRYLNLTARPRKAPRLHGDLGADRVAAPIYVAETDARAKDAVERSISAAFSKYLNLPSR